MLFQAAAFDSQPVRSNPTHEKQDDVDDQDGADDTYGAALRALSQFEKSSTLNAVEDIAHASALPGSLCQARALPIFSAVLRGEIEGVFGVGARVNDNAVFVTAENARGFAARKRK